MKIAIIGTRGIPNQYGGFEQLAEYLSVGLCEKGHEVTVYNSSLHAYKENYLGKVRIMHAYDPEDKLGSFGQFIYDFNCIRHCRTQSYEAILQLGYTSSSIWSFMFPPGVKIITNMDGMEWKRSKYGSITRWFLRFAERWAVRHSHVLVADSIGIQNYLRHKYGNPSVYIPYGAEVQEIKDQTALETYGLSPASYYLVIARMEPENNIEAIIKGYLLSSMQIPLVLVGSTSTRFGEYLRGRYGSQFVKFTGAIFDKPSLDCLRAYSKIYFHGHSVGGTNPSLLEAMACGSVICAHANEFNESILGQDALYFRNEDDINKIIRRSVGPEERHSFVNNNLNKIKTKYTWENICNAYDNTLRAV
jgi:glycosyltransferase involved in cell wall biosynthesis